MLRVKLAQKEPYHDPPCIDSLLHHCDHPVGGVIAVLVMGYVTLPAILMAAGVGALLALPISYMVAYKITHLQNA